MSKSDDLRKNAANCVTMAEAADCDQKKKRFTRMATAWKSLADTQAWLDGEVDRKAEAPNPPSQQSGC